tara:strand:+ start:350 stop:571 length:222 start_codon:yes stop_codon:yes gene_type:complete
MKCIIIFKLLAITTINPVVHAHENHDHQIYKWPNSKIKTIKSKSTFNVEKLEDKKNEAKTKVKNSWIRIFKYK